MELTDLIDFEQNEEEIVERLQPIVNANVTVNLLPENQEYKLPTGNNVAVYVMAADTQYDDTNDTSGRHQDENITISVLILGAKLRGSSGIYPIISYIRALMIGWQPSFSNKRVSIVGGNFVQPEERDLNTWRYMLKFRASSVMVSIEEEEVGPLITQITHNSQITNETTITRDDSIDGGGPFTVFDAEIDGGPSIWPY